MNATELLSQILANNIGNKLTLEMAHGIVSVFSQNLPKDTLTDSDVSAVESNGQQDQGNGCPTSG